MGEYGYRNARSGRSDCIPAQQLGQNMFMGGGQTGGCHQNLRIRPGRRGARTPEGRGELSAKTNVIAK